MASPRRYSSVTRDVPYAFPPSAAMKPQLSVNGRSVVFPLAALSVEFVAKPQEAHRVETAIPAAVAGALKDVAGFAGCLVMISDQEARLVTVLTFWAGDERAKHCNENVRWVHALLEPYLDRCLRVQTMVAHLPVLPMIRAEADSADERSMTQEPTPEEETVCVA
jgi:hypothetical protein